MSLRLLGRATGRLWMSEERMNEVLGWDHGGREEVEPTWTVDVSSVRSGVS